MEQPLIDAPRDRPICIDKVLFDATRSAFIDVLDQLEALGSSFDPTVIREHCACARLAIERLTPTSDYDAAATLWDRRPNSFSVESGDHFYLFADALFGATLVFVDRPLFSLASMAFLAIGDQSFFRLVSTGFRYSDDAVHWALVGCEVIKKTSDHSYLSELPSLCPSLFEPAALERFHASVERAPTAARVASSTYLRLPLSERGRVTPWEIMHHQVQR